MSNQTLMFMRLTAFAAVTACAATDPSSVDGNTDAAAAGRPGGTAGAGGFASGAAGARYDAEQAGGAAGSPDASASSGGADGGRADVVPNEPMASACDPKNVPSAGLLIWLSAGTGVIESDAGVQRWEPVRPGGPAAVQAQASLRPRVVLRAVGDVPAVRFDGVDDQMSMPAVPVNGLSEMTLVMVSATRKLSLSEGNWCGRATETGCSGTFRPPLVWNETGSWGGVFLSPQQREITFRFGSGQKTYDEGQYQKLDPRVGWTRPQPIGDAFTATMAVHAGVMNRLYVNGKLVLESPAAGAVSQIRNSSDSPSLGVGGVGRFPWNGDLAEYLAFNRALSNDERTKLDAYLACRYPALGF